MPKNRVQSNIYTPINNDEIEALYILQKESLILNNIRIWNKNDIESLMQKDNVSAYILQNNNINASYIIFSDLAHECEILSLGTIEKMRGNGFASELLEYFIDKNIENSEKEIFLEVEENNDKAIDLYKKFSFEKVGVRKKYYSNNLNALIMKRS